MTTDTEKMVWAATYSRVLERELPEEAIAEPGKSRFSAEQEIAAVARAAVAAGEAVELLRRRGPDAMHWFRDDPAGKIFAEAMIDSWPIGDGIHSGGMGYRVPRMTGSDWYNKVLGEPFKPEGGNDE